MLVGVAVDVKCALFDFVLVELSLEAVTKDVKAVVTSEVGNAISNAVLGSAVSTASVEKEVAAAISVGKSVAIGSGNHNESVGTQLVSSVVGSLTS
jgi:hypothetical protein